MFCTNCGYQIPGDSAFCSNCGAQVSVTPTVAQTAPPVQREQHQERKTRQKKTGKRIAVIILILVVLLFAFFVLLAVDRVVNRERPPANFQSGQKLDMAPTSLPSNAAALTAADWSTDALPRESDFDWFYDHTTGDLHPQIPEGAVKITDPSLLAGGWKALVLRTPMSNPYPNYWNMNLTISGDAVDAVQYWSGTVKNGIFEDASKGNPNSFKGTLDPGSLRLELTDVFGCELTILNWYEYNGAQYGIGTYNCVFPSDAEEPLGMAAFCRP